MQYFTHERYPVTKAETRRSLGWPDSKGRLQLESKADMRSRGLPSPDRADAVLGAMMRGSSGGGITLIDNFFRREEAAGIFGAPFRVGRHRGLLV